MEKKYEGILRAKTHSGADFELDWGVVGRALDYLLWVAPKEFRMGSWGYPEFLLDAYEQRKVLAQLIESERNINLESEVNDVVRRTTGSPPGYDALGGSTEETSPTIEPPSSEA